MRKFCKFAVAAAILSAGFISCSKEDSGKNEDPAKKSVVIDTRAYDKWTYFSFEKGIIGTYTETEFDYKNNTEWDLAFHRWDVRTNGGESGKGRGGAAESTYGSLNTASWSVHPSQFRYITDTQIKTYMKAPDMNSESGMDQRVSVPANTELAKWMTVTMTTIPPSYTLSRKAYVVQTASGKTAVVLFTNYMNEKAEKGYVNFDYVYPVN